MFPHAGNGICAGHEDADRALVAAQIIDELELRDGERVLVRPIRPADGDQLAELHARLSPDSIYRRYFGFKSRLSPAEIRRFTGIAEEWRFALVGVRSAGQLAGVARYEGQAGRSDAEIALIVDDALHHLGLGTLLLQRLVDVAQVSGMASLTAVVLPSNMAMLHLLQALRVPSTSARDSDSIEVTMHLADLELPADRSRIAAAHVAEAAAIRATLVSLRAENRRTLFTGIWAGAFGPGFPVCAPAHRDRSAGTGRPVSRSCRSRPRTPR